METQMDAGQVAPSPIAQEKSLVRERVGTGSLTKHLRYGEEAIRAILLFCGAISIFTTLGIVFVLGEESLLFFDSESWVSVRAPIVEEGQEPLATLRGEIDAETTTLSLSFEASRIPFQQDQFIQIGEERMRITGRGTNTVTVERGADKSEAIAHESGADVFPMDEIAVRLVDDITAEDTVIALEEGLNLGREFEVGQRLQIGLEIVQVVEVSPDSLVVERGMEGTEAREHAAEETRFQLAEEVTLSEFLTGTTWSPTAGSYGIWPLLLSTIIISFIALLLAVPMGLGAAIYLSEYATPRVRGTLKPILEILAGVPTVVYGFFALWFVRPLLGNFINLEFYNMLTAGVVVGILIIPLISSLSEDALSAVPRALREASFGLGATKLETTIKVVLPAAVSGVTAAVIVAMSRAVGETMIVAIAAGSGPNFTFDVTKGAESMTGHIARISGGDLSYNSIDYNSIFAIGAMLFILTLLLNIVSGVISRALREEY